MPTDPATPSAASSGIPLALPQLGPDLRRVEQALRTAVLADDPFLTEIAGHLLSAGGKRLRPVLALCAAYCGSAGTASDDVVQAAIAVELVHVGSLYHDDVIDEATTRRGVVTANAHWNNTVAILSGDYCLARAAEIAARLGAEIAGIIGHTIGRLVEGQVGELKTLFDLERTESAYFASIDGKTASLMGTACRVGAIAAGLPEDRVETLTEYGQRVGMVFQVADDVLDIVATDEQLGKPAGNDVVEGVYTLPVLRALRDPAVGEELRQVLKARVDRAGIDRVRKLVRTSPGVESSIVEARRFADEAAELANRLGAGTLGSELAHLGHRLLDRLPL